MLESIGRFVNSFVDRLWFFASAHLCRRVCACLSLAVAPHEGLRKLFIQLSALALCLWGVSQGIALLESAQDRVSPAWSFYGAGLVYSIGRQASLAYVLLLRFQGDGVSSALFAGSNKPDVVFVCFVLCSYAFGMLCCWTCRTAG